MTETARMGWMDLLRGMAILMVLLWHAPAVPALFGYEMPTWLRTANDALLPFRMPMLMFLSGLLLPRALAKPLPGYYAGKLRMLLWPYLLWGFLHLNLYGSDHPLWHPRAWIGTGYLWFLFCIMVYYFVAPLLPERFLILLIPISMIVSLLVEDPIAVKLTYFATFFFAGHAIASRPQLLERLLAPRLLMLWTVLTLCFAAVSATLGVSIAYRGDLAVFSFAGVLVAVVVARKVVASNTWARRIRWLQFVGRHSLVYYVSHFPVMIVVLKSFEFVGADDVLLLSIIGLATALLVGTLAATYQDKALVGWMFRAPALPALLGGRSVKRAG